MNIVYGRRLYALSLGGGGGGGGEHNNTVHLPR